MDRYEIFEEVRKRLNIDYNDNILDNGNYYTLIVTFTLMNNINVNKLIKHLDSDNKNNVALSLWEFVYKVIKSKRAQTYKKIDWAKSDVNEITTLSLLAKYSDIKFYEFVSKNLILKTE